MQKTNNRLGIFWSALNFSRESDYNYIMSAMLVIFAVRTIIVLGQWIQEYRSAQKYKRNII